ncbi:V-type proton ATPase subunit E2-like [Micractinium conductrix]|uniref:V-type proton ATPase subunit E2-like n=1 Tax=Micractinium conductrix TaxID=554055 RepID=A0A2P6VLP7_9CHLO|nr:V-type proton ATPase subunit E2-like [Micractinium conductrix]|eukprot:PSC75013.1 V-type proton ATPase subunit E2-like [Micractinium conductrix]
MNDTEVSKTISQMVMFIRQEAEEKAAEIAVSAEEEFNITKLQLLEAEKARVRKEFERREGTVEVKKKVEYSKQLNESRIKVLQAREDAVQTVLQDAFAQLVAMSQDKAAYKRLLADLLAQGMYKLAEPKVLVRCREMDVQLVRDAFSAAQTKYQEVYGTAAPALELDPKHPLPPPPKAGKQHDDEFQTCCGGVVVTSGDGRIVCSNTLDDRLRITYSSLLPEL